MGFRLPRGIVWLFFIVCALVAAAFWVGPLRPRPPELRLVALSADGRFRADVDIPTEWAQLLPPASEATARLPLILAVHNEGVRTAQPTELALSLPTRYRVTNARGMPLPVQRTMGNPLARYELALRTPPIEPGYLPTMLAGVDTLWLEPIVPTMYCTTLSDSVPEFVSAPAQDPQMLANVRVFYSFTGPRIRQRQTGLLTVQMEPELVKRTPPANPPVFATQVIKPEAPRPRMSELAFVGSRATWCGDPGQPMEVFDALWETPEGGRFFVLYHRGVPRKYLFDLDRDSIIELEMWDRDGDGKFESRRQARMAIPAFLMPYPEPEIDTTAAVLDSLDMSLDSAAATPEWLQLFHDTAGGPMRFSGERRRAAPSARPPVAPPAAPAPADPEWLQLFNNTGAGPFRFYRAQLGAIIEAPPAPPVRTCPKLLGVPVDEYRRQQQPSAPRRDSARRDTLRNEPRPLR